MRTKLKWRIKENINTKKAVYRYFDRLYNGDFKNNLNGKRANVCVKRTCENMEK